jgi:hypothetical protein
MLYDLKTQQRRAKAKARLAKQLDRVVYIIEHGGWCKGQLVQNISTEDNERYSHCLVGAVQAACGNETGKKACYEMLSAQIPTGPWDVDDSAPVASPKDRCINFNDWPSVGCALMLDVIHAARDAAKL